MSHLHSSAGPGGPGPGWRDMASQDRRQVQLFLADPGTENPMGSGTLTPRLVEHNGTSRFIWFNLHIGETRKLKSTEGTTITELIAAKLEREARPLNPRPVRFPWDQQHSVSVEYFVPTKPPTLSNRGRAELPGGGWKKTGLDPPHFHSGPQDCFCKPQACTEGHVTDCEMHPLPPQVPQDAGSTSWVSPHFTPQAGCFPWGSEVCFQELERELSQQYPCLGEPRVGACWALGHPQERKAGWNTGRFSAPLHPDCSEVGTWNPVLPQALPDRP